jgi:hypothetical protein
MWNSEQARIYGGYPGNVLTRCIDQTVTLWQTPKPQFVGDQILLTTLAPQCINENNDR